MNKIAAFVAAAALSVSGLSHAQQVVFQTTTQPVQIRTVTTTTRTVPVTRVRTYTTRPALRAVRTCRRTVTLHNGQRTTRTTCTTRPVRR